MMAPSMQAALRAHPGLTGLYHSALADPTGLTFAVRRGRLVERLGSAGAAACADAMEPTWPMWRQTLPRMGLRDAARQHASYFRTFAAAGSLRIPGAQVVGRTRDPDIPVFARELFLACLRDVEVFGTSNLRRFEHGVMMDYQFDEPGRYRILWEGDPQVIQWGDREATIQRPADDPMVVPEAVDLVGLYAHFWGHSVLEFAPKLLMADADEACPRDAPMLVDAHAPPSHVALLRALSDGRRPVIPVTMNRSVVVERLWVASTITFVPPWPAPGQRFDAAWSSVSPAAAAAILARAPALRPAAPGPRRLFLARRESRVRKLVNQAQVIERFERAGFAVVYPEDHPVEVQVQLMQEATHVAGPGGSNMMLPMFFGNPAMSLVVLLFPDIEELPTLTAIAEARGQRVRVATGRFEPGNTRRPGDSNYSVPLEVIDQALREIGL